MADIRMDGVYYRRIDMVDGEPCAGTEPWRILAVDVADSMYPVAAECCGSVNVFTKDGHYSDSGNGSKYDLVEYVAPQYAPFDNLYNEWQFGWMVKSKISDIWSVPTSWSHNRLFPRVRNDEYTTDGMLELLLLSKDGGKTWQPCGKLKSPA